MMLYKPKYCCQCGEKIDRVDWKFWTSRRFCPLCETELVVYDWMPRILVGITLLFGLYGIGSYFQKPEKQLNIAANRLAEVNWKSDAAQQKTIAHIPIDGGVQLPMQPSNSVVQNKSPVAALKSDLRIKQTAGQTVELPEKVYFCGAATKKGTMCSRRMKKGGRCWQHEGQAALMPQEKLIVSQ
jgi:hypothetical protein